MMSLATSGWLYASVIIIVALTLVVLISALRHFWYREFVRGSFKGLGACVLGLVAVVVFLVGLNLLTWQRFTHERPVAQLAFHQLAPQRFAVTLRLPNGHIRQFELRGDAWQIDARMLKWTNAATLLGLDPLYRLERVDGRFQQLQQAQTDKPSVVGLTTSQGLSLWQAARDGASWLPFVDASYGSATYLPMHDGAIYQVSISHTGLLARPSNPVADRAVKAWR